MLKSVIRRLKNIIEHFKELWILYFGGFVFVALVILWPVKDYIDRTYTRDITCTVTSATTELRRGGSGGRSASSPVSRIETEECGRLSFYSTFVKGAGMRDITDRLVPGEKYIFTINQYEIISSYGIVSNIRDASGQEIDFTSD